MNYFSDGSGNLVRISASIAPDAVPKILAQPVQRIATPGDVVTFAVVVADTLGVTFQWRVNDVAIPGATGDSLLLANVSVADEGQYSVVVTNGVGSVTSVSVAL